MNSSSAQTWSWDGHARSQEEENAILPCLPKKKWRRNGIRWEDEGGKDPGKCKGGWHVSAEEPCPRDMGLQMPGKRMAVVDGGGLLGGNDDLWFSGCIAGWWNGAGR